MKTIAFKDRAVGRTNLLHIYYKEGQTRHERINNALKELKHTGNINVYLINGNKTRFLFSRSM